MATFLHAGLAPLLQAALGEAARAPLHILMGFKLIGGDTVLVAAYPVQGPEDVPALVAGLPFGVFPSRVLAPSTSASTPLLAACAGVVEEPVALVWEAEGGIVAVKSPGDGTPVALWPPSTSEPLSGLAVVRSRTGVVVEVSTGGDAASWSTSAISAVSGALASARLLLPSGISLTFGTDAGRADPACPPVASLFAARGEAAAKKKGSAAAGATPSKASARFLSVLSPEDCVGVGAVVVASPLPVAQAVTLRPLAYARPPAPAPSPPRPPITLSLSLDVVTICDPAAPVLALLGLLREAFLSQAAALASVVWRADAAPGAVLAASGRVHAFPAAVAHAPLPLVVLSGEEEEEASPAAVATRARLHALFALPADRPLLRAAAALPWTQQSDAGAASEGSTHLLSVHVGVPVSRVAGGRVHAVRGPYAYYHYLQDRMNDKGWGCAYRSLQTIASWFQLNLYTQAPVPTHRDIQRALVACGDQPATIVGSQQWLGSQEVGYVLQELYGVESKFIFVANGGELPNHARALAHHLDTVGTPVMMGGGMLAFTILGVDFNEASGAAEFLILDPHYTGVDDLKTIQTKSVTMEGYRAMAVSWRPASSFSSSSYYNLCLPGRPSLPL